MLCIRKSLLFKTQDVLCINTTAIGTGMIAMFKNKFVMSKMPKPTTPRTTRQLLHFLLIGSIILAIFSSITASVSPIFTSILR